jgi:hypothetical protein
MTVLASYVLRLRTAELAAGRLVGVVEDVRSGERATVGDVAELVAFCAACLDATVHPAATVTDTDTS